jgi:hypothetical protein
MNSWPVLITCMLSQSGLAQTTCYTNPQGTTICSNSGSVIQGNTNSVGNSVYRDDRGNPLEFQVDQFGNATVEPRSGDPIHWSQRVLGERKYPNPGGTASPPPPSPPPLTEPGSEGRATSPVPVAPQRLPRIR